MKKKIIALLLAAVMMLSFSSCAVFGKLIPKWPGRDPDPTVEPADPTSTPRPTSMPKPTESPKPTKGPAEHTPKPTPAVVYDDSVIIEACSEEGSFTDQWGNTYDYKYHLPQLDLDKPGAREFNGDIMYVFGDSVAEALESVENDEFSGLLDVYWQSAWNGDVLSILVEADYDWAFSDYVVFHYDCAEDRVLYDSEILDMLGMSYDEFIARARYTAELEFDETYNFYLTEYADQYSYDISYVTTRSWTLDDYTINGDLQIFPAEKTMVAMPIGSLAGASYYYELLELKDLPGQLTRFAFERYISAEVGEGYGKIVIEDVPEYADEIDDLEAECGVTVNTPYYISGLYSEYTDIAVGFYNDVYPFLFLTTVRGEVEAVDIYSGLEADCLCAFQLQGIGNINYTYYDEDDYNGLGYHNVAYAADGTCFDLEEYVYEAKLAGNAIYPDHLSSSYYDTLEDGTESEIIRYFDLDDDNYIDVSTLVVETGEYTTVSGWMEYLGCNDDGVVYYYFIDDTWEVGAIAVRRIEDNYLVTTYGRWGSVFRTYDDDQALYIPTYG
ncbi:MAG: hypothetical protein J6P71_07140 [Oscillospiraceae bacterium]|nr:hypothetical protein [Oscillospiraceae bacterium]